MIGIIVYERKRMSHIEMDVTEIRQVRSDINTVHRYITQLALLGEGVIGWNETDRRHYHAQRLRADSLLQALKPHCRNYVRPVQIDTLRTLLAEKETHLLHLTEILARQDEADSLLVNHLPEVARRATRVRTIKQKKSGLAGFFGGKKTIQIIPSAKELYQFSDSLIALQRRQAEEMDAYADSLHTRNRALNQELNRLIDDLDGQAQKAFTQGNKTSQKRKHCPSGYLPSPYRQQSSCYSCLISPSTGKSDATTTNGNSVSNSLESCRRAITQMKS